jgi:hypothetical protein
LRRLSILVGLCMLSSPVIAEQSKPSSAPSGNEPIVSTSVNLNIGSGKLPLCFWGGAVYSPGSHLDYFDVSKKADACFHCNVDGTWDTPCQ